MQKRARAVAPLFALVVALERRGLWSWPAGPRPLALSGLVLLALFAAGADQRATAYHGTPVKQLFTQRWSSAGDPFTVTTDVHFDCGGCQTNGWTTAVENALGDWDRELGVTSPNHDFRYDYGGDITRAHDASRRNHIYADGTLGSDLFGQFQSFYVSGSSLIACQPWVTTPCEDELWDKGRTRVRPASFTGDYNLTSFKRATVAHELGHGISLNHESESCGEVPAPIAKPNTVMSYECILPVGASPYGDGMGLYRAYNWDFCGSNHAYNGPETDDGC